MEFQELPPVHPVQALVNGLRGRFGKKPSDGAEALNLRPGLKGLGPNQIVTFVVDASPHLSQIMQTIGSCHTLEQLDSCRGWIVSLIDNGGLSSFDAVQLCGALDMSEGWLQRRFEPMQKAWKWQGVRT